MKKRINAKGRMTYSFRLKPVIMNEFKKLCDEKGFALSKRLEILMRIDVWNGGIFLEDKKGEKV